MTENTELDTLATYRRRHVERWRSCAESQAAYCKANDLPYHRFVYWRRKYEEDTTEPGDERSAGFACVAYQRAEPGLSISLPGGLVLRGISAHNLPVVQQLLAHLS